MQSNTALILQVKNSFFDLIDEMVDKLYQRAQDPNDDTVDSSFVYRTFADIPAAQKYNMDECGSDTNKGRKKAIGGQSYS